MRPRFSQVTSPDRPIAHRTEGLSARSPAIDQHESHASSPKAYRMGGRHWTAERRRDFCHLDCFRFARPLRSWTAVICNRLFRSAGRLGGLRQMAQSYVGKRPISKGIRRLYEGLWLALRSRLPGRRRQASPRLDPRSDASFPGQRGNDGSACGQKETDGSACRGPGGGTRLARSRPFWQVLARGRSAADLPGAKLGSANRRCN
jgi:hypothetical protein